MTTRKWALVLAGLVAVGLHAATPAAAQETMTASVSPEEVEPGEVVIVEGGAPQTCSAVAHATSEDAIGGGQVPVEDGRYSLRLGIPERLAPGDVEVELYCLEDRSIGATVAIHVVPESRGTTERPAADHQSGSEREELATTGPDEMLLLIAVLGMSLVVSGIVARRTSRRKS